jgi:LPXTG-motif cell wall-anchored protein
MTGFPAALLSIAVLAAFALAAGGLYLLVRRKNAKQGLLMLLTAAITLANVLVWTL